MGTCAAVVGDATNYEQIQSGVTLNQSKDKQDNIVRQTSVPTIDNSQHVRKTYKNYRISITQSYIHQMQKLLYQSHMHAENKSFYRITSTITSLILSFLPRYFRVYGIGKNLMSNSEISEFERLYLFEPKLSSLDNIYRGHNKYFIKSYVSEIYGVGSNLFDGLCLNETDDNDNNYHLKHITSFYKYFNFVDQKQQIELISNSMYSNDVIIKLTNGSIYMSSLTMSDMGEWKRVFIKHLFDDLAINKHLSITWIECGLLHSLFLVDNGTVYSYGNNNNGQCGLGYLSSRENKLKIITAFIEENIKITAIDCGEYHSCAVDSGGNLWCFGLNDNKQCSQSQDMGQVSVVIAAPMMIFISETIVKAECGESFTVYLTNTGYYGGFGKMIVSTLERVNITKWECDIKDNLFKDLSCGYNHVILIGQDNKIYSHGSNQHFKSGLKIGRAAKPTKVKCDKLPDLQPCAVIAGMHNSIVIFNSASH